jgi:hypothetical protein
LEGEKFRTLAEHFSVEIFIERRLEANWQRSGSRSRLQRDSAMMAHS